MAIRAEDVSLLELLKNHEANKRSSFLDNDYKNKNQTFDKHKPGGIQPSIAGPAVKCSHEVQMQTGEKPGASDGVKYPESVKGQR